MAIICAYVVIIRLRTGFYRSGIGVSDDSVAVNDRSLLTTPFNYDLTVYSISDWTWPVIGADDEYVQHLMIGC